MSRKVIVAIAMVFAMMAMALPSSSAYWPAWYLDPPAYQDNNGCNYAQDLWGGGGEWDAKHGRTEGANPHPDCWGARAIMYYSVPGNYYWRAIDSGESFGDSADTGLQYGNIYVQGTYGSMNRTNQGHGGWRWLAPQYS